MKNKVKEAARGSGGARWISFRESAGMRDDLKRIAAAERRSISSIIRIALSGFIVEYDSAKKRKG